MMRVNSVLFGYKILTRLNVSTGQFTSCTEMDSDEFTLFRKASFQFSSKIKYVIAFV